MKSELGSNKKYPTIVHFDEDTLPALRNWKVGGKYSITLEVEQTSMRKGDEFEDSPKPKVSASFKVLSARPLGGDNTTVPKRGEYASKSMQSRLK